MWSTSMKTQNDSSWHSFLRERSKNGLMDRNATMKAVEETAATPMKSTSMPCQMTPLVVTPLREIISQPNLKFNRQLSLNAKRKGQQQQKQKQQQDFGVENHQQKQIAGVSSPVSSKRCRELQTTSQRKQAKKTQEHTEDSKLDDLIHTLRKVRSWIRDRREKRRCEKRVKPKLPARCTSFRKRDGHLKPDEWHITNVSNVSTTTTVPTIPEHSVYPQAMEIDPPPHGAGQSCIYDEEMEDLQESAPSPFSRMDYRRWSTISY